MVVAGNAAKFSSYRWKSSEEFNSARNIEREELKEENRLRRQSGVVPLPEKKFRGDIEGPGRVREGRPNPAGASTATPNGVHRVYKAGDPELGLDVSKLNAYAAMQATLKEMGFDEGAGSGEAAEEGDALAVTPPPNPSRKYKAGDPALRLDVAHLNAFLAMEATMKEMGFEEGGEGEEGEEGWGGHGDPRGEHAAAAMAVVAPPLTGGGSVTGASSKRAQVQPTSSRQASRLVAFVPDPYRQEPPDFEPPPKQRCFQEEEEGAGRRMQMATVAAVLVLLVGCVVGISLVLASR